MIVERSVVNVFYDLVSHIMIVERSVVNVLNELGNSRQNDILFKSQKF